jgi:hypothetical protein
MGRRIIVPQQTVELSFTPEHVENVAAYMRLYKAYNMGQLGIEIEPLVNRFWEYSQFYVWGEEESQEKYNFLGERQTPTRRDWVVLPERARLTVKHDITAQKILEALLPLERWYEIPDEWGDYYRFPRLFKNVAKQKIFKNEVIRLLDSPLLLDSTKTTTYTLSSEQPGHELEFEFLITTFKAWNFVRLSAVTWNGNRFEHWIRKPDGRMVYPEKSKNIGVLKEHLPIVFTTSELFIAFYVLISRLIYLQGPITLINKDMGLYVHTDILDRYHLTIRAEFQKIEPDYTTFLE